MFLLLIIILANYHNKSAFAVNETLDSSVADMMDWSSLPQTVTISTLCVAVTCNIFTSHERTLKASTSGVSNKIF